MNNKYKDFPHLSANIEELKERSELYFRKVRSWQKYIHE